jgi:hypothetical protein
MHETRRPAFGFKKIAESLRIVPVVVVDARQLTAAHVFPGRLAARFQPEPHKAGGHSDETEQAEELGAVHEAIVLLAAEWEGRKELLVVSRQSSGRLEIRPSVSTTYRQDPYMCMANSKMLRKCAIRHGQAFWPRPSAS